MKAEPGLTTGISETEKVEEFMNTLKHPLKDVAVLLRELILSADKKVSEGIFWKAPVFYYSGKMKPFDPKEYKRYLVGFNFFKQDGIRLIFLRGASVKDPAGLLEGDYSDGRRVATFADVADVKNKAASLKKILKQLVGAVDN